MTLLDDVNLASLTMRSLGAALGVEAMSLYRYVSGKDDLLQAVADRVVTEFIGESGPRPLPGEEWDDYLGRLARDVRQAALAHPRAFSLVVSQPTGAPWLRPPLRQSAWVEEFLAALIAQGFTPRAASLTYADLTAFLVGHLLLETAQASRTARRGTSDRSTVDLQSTVDSHPRLAILRDELTAESTSSRFERNLDSLLQDVSRRLAS